MSVVGEVLPVLVVGGLLAVVVILGLFIRRGGHRRMSRRVVVGSLGGLAATLAATVGAVSLTRIAGDYLGFPPGLEWTLTGAVDIAGIAGGIMWTAFDGRVREIGRPMNIVCTLVSGLGVGLDHATHARGGEVWQWTAFGAGLFIPALAAWILHSLAVIADVVGAPSQAGDRQGDNNQAGHRQPPHRQPGDGQVTNRQAVITRVGDSQDTAIVAKQPTLTDSQAALPAGRQAGHSPATDRQGGDQTSTARPTPQPATRPSDRSPTPIPPRPVRPLAAVPEPRLPWMTDTLIAAVVKARRKDATYGRGQIVTDHKIGSGQARTLLEYINRHGLMRETA